MRPNLPSQIAQRLAAPLQRHWKLLRIVVSSGPCVGRDWCSQGRDCAPAVLLRLHSMFLTGIVDMPSPAIGSSDQRD
jgi:hypothetical protein